MQISFEPHEVQINQFEATKGSSEELETNPAGLELQNCFDGAKIYRVSDRYISETKSKL